MRCSRLIHNLPGSAPGGICSTAAKQFVFHSTKCCKSTQSLNAICVFACYVCVCLRKRKRARGMYADKRFNVLPACSLYLCHKEHQITCVKCVCVCTPWAERLDVMLGIMRPAGRHASNIHRWMHTCTSSMKHPV